MATTTLQNSRKVAIVTGATSGIGSWVAELLHKQGYRVALCGRREKKGASIADKLDPCGITAMFVVCDVAIYDSQSFLFRKVWEEWQRIDVVVANAGVVDRDSKYMLRAKPSDSSVELSHEQPDTTCTDVNLKGSIYTIQLAIDYMQRNPDVKGGKIIATSSVLGLYANPTFPEYCAAKAGLNQYVKAIAPVLLLHHNIAVNSIMPGPIDTEVMPDMADAFPPEHMTLRSTLLRCFQSCIEDMTGKSGGVIEVGRSASIERHYPAHSIGAAEQCWKTPYDPWFEALHGVKSGLAGARAGHVSSLVRVTK